MNLNQVTLPAQDLQTSCAFYLQLGFTQIVDSPHYARFQCPQGEATFSLPQVAAKAAPAGAIVYFETGQLDAKVAQLKRMGIVFTQEPVDQAWLWREARLKDPSGNEICLYHAGENRINPPWRVAIRND